MTNVRFAERWLLGVVFILLAQLLWAPAVAQAQAHRRFLLIYSGHSTLPANAEATAGVAAVFDRTLEAGYEVYAEYRDDQRFPGPEADRAFAEEMDRKYRGQSFDAILAFGHSALTYAVGHRAELGLDVPVVFGGIGDGVLADLDLPPDVHGIRSSYSLPGTLALARRLQPGARRAVVLTGSSDFDRSWVEAARSEFAGAGGIVEGIAVDYASDLTVPRQRPWDI